MAKMQHGVKPDIFKYAKALGQEQSEAGASLGEALKKAKTELPVSRDTTTSRPPEASLAEANAKIARLEGSLAALGRDDIAERRVLEDALAKVRARAIVAGQRLHQYKKYCEGATKRLEKAQEVVRSIEGDSTRGGVGRRETLFGSSPIRSRCSTSSVPQFTVPGTDELTHLRCHVAQLEGDLRQSHPLATEKISAGSSHARGCSFEGLRASTSFWVALVPVSKSGSALMSNLIWEADKNRPQVHGEGAQ